MALFKLTVRIPYAVKAAVYALSSEDGRSVQWHVARALINYLKSKGRQI